MERKATFLEHISSVAQQQGTVLPGVPLVELAGDRRVLIEHHCGVTEYSCEQVCVKVKFGWIRVLGCGLQIQTMTKDQLVISGTVDGISLLRR